MGGWILVLDGRHLFSFGFSDVLLVFLSLILSKGRLYFDDYDKGLSYNIPIKGYGLDPYFRSAAALSDAPPPLPVDLAACEGLAGGS